MTEQERLYAQYEDAFFALLMHEIAEAEGEALLEQNEQLLADPDAAVPDVVRKRCLRTIEKSRRNARLQSNTEKLLRVLNRVALWLLVPLFLFAGVFAASETVRVRTLNYLIEEFDDGTAFYFRSDPGDDTATPELPAAGFAEVVSRSVPEEYAPVFESTDDISCTLFYKNASGDEIAASEYHLKDLDATVVLDTESADVQDLVIHGQNVMVIRKDGSYQVAWIDGRTQTMCAINGSDGNRAIIDSLVEQLLSTS